MLVCLTLQLSGDFLTYAGTYILFAMFAAPGKWNVSNLYNNTRSKTINIAKRLISVTYEGRGVVVKVKKCVSHTIDLQLKKKSPLMCSASS